MIARVITKVSLLDFSVEFASYIVLCLWKLLYFSILHSLATTCTSLISMTVARKRYEIGNSISLYYFYYDPRSLRITSTICS